MQENRPIIDLDYRTVRYASPRGDQTVAYMIAVAMGACAVLVPFALIEIVSDSSRPGPAVIALVFACVAIGGIGSVVASNIFHAVSGKGRVSPRLIVIMGTINGLVGMGAFLTCVELDTHQMLGHAAFCRDGILVLNVALPLLMGVIKRASQQRLST